MIINSAVLARKLQHVGYWKDDEVTIKAVKHNELSEFSMLSFIADDETKFEVEVFAQLDWDTKTPLTEEVEYSRSALNRLQKCLSYAPEQPITLVVTNDKLFTTIDF